ncbi:unnamed protein product, partial [Tetraodon nigroviridis]
MQEVLDGARSRASVLPSNAISVPSRHNRHRKKTNVLRTACGMRREVSCDKHLGTVAVGSSSPCALARLHPRLLSPRSKPPLTTGYRMDQHPSARSCTSRGASSCEAVPTEPSMNLYIHSTTGTRFELSLPQEETVEGLKKRLSQKLKVPKERLALLHKETRLSSGKLQDLGISDGSKLTLVPTVEAGLM